MTVERTTLHVSDDTGRIAMLEERTFGTASDDNDTAALLTRYIYSNHLQSSSLELDESGEIIRYEEYHPYGTTSYQENNAAVQACAKRYRYTGKERDEESGLYYHGARYYIPWLGRWCASDPLENDYSPQSPYVYCSDNPVNRVDPSGMGDDDVKLPKGVKNGGVAGGFEGGGAPNPSNVNSLKPIAIPHINTSGNVDDTRDARSSPKLTFPNAIMFNGRPIRRIPYDEQLAIGQDVYGNVKTASQKDLRMWKANSQFNYENELADALKNGVVASVGYLAGGRKWALIGAQLDQVIAAKGLWNMSKPVPNLFIESLPIAKMSIGTASTFNESFPGWYATRSTPVPFTKNTMFHYSSEAGYNAINVSRELLPSLGFKNARYGAGQYLTDIAPGTATMGETSARLYGVPWNRTSITHYFEIDVSGLDIIKNKQYNFLNSSLAPLNLDGRIINQGKTSFLSKKP